ncbi:MAG: non-ribosomal peptide synthase/polyketide synthase [Pseudomonadota bacterium]
MQSTTEDAAPAAAPPATAPLSLAQQRLWFLDQYQPGDVAYNVAVAVALHGPLDAAALEGALNDVAARHGSLRARFARDAHGEPVQIIAPRLHIPLPLRDVGTADPQPLILAEARTPFDLEQGPLLRAQLLRRSAQDHLLLLTLHHIVSDGWSMGVLARELGALYGARLRAQASPLAPLPMQYADYALWQREWLQGPALQQQLDYWTRQLDSAPGLLALPTDHPRPPVQRHRGARHGFAVDAALVARLKAFTQSRQATPFAALAAVFAALLARYAGQPEVNLGTAVANRGSGRTRRLIGFFVNTLVLRIGLDADERFDALLARVKETALQAFAHQELPFERLVEALHPERDAGHAPLVQAMLVLQNAPAVQPELAGLRVERLPLDNGSSKFDILLELTEQPQGGGFTAELEYDSDLFEAGSIAQLARHFTGLLRQVLAAPEARIMQLPLLPPEDHRQVVVAWNATREDYPAAGQTLDRLLRAQALRTPDRVALAFEDRQLSYAQLDARSNQLAHWLRAQGVGTDVPVGVRMERGIEMVVALLGIVKAGGAYVPLDPAYPADRLAYMVQDARPALVLTQEQWPALGGQPVTAPEPLAHPGSLAYVIYTSGSTGRPKGVGVPHEGIVNRLQWMQEEYGLGEHDSVLQKTPFSFDVSVWEFFWPLITGATLVVARPGGHQDADYLLDTIADQRISTAHFVPPMLDSFLEQARSRIGRAACLKRVLCSGQALPRELQDRFLLALPEVELHNLYGPTEASVDVTAWACDAGSPLSSVPIGKPVANTQMHVLDAHFNPVPVGVAGELYIAGVQLARGYLHQPALTADRFVPNPFGEAGSRMYRTGDLARYLPDGNIDYLGRIDHQVKIRGLRIELGEIESVLAAQPGLRDAVVLAREDVPGDQRLVAYLLAPAGEAPKPAALRAALATQLPAYMVPAHYVLLEALPLTPNGKVDRKALPAPHAAGEVPAPSRADEPPQGALETTLAALWAQLLDTPQAGHGARIGRHANFFALGGHSLLATRLVSRLRDALGIELPVRAVFEAPSIAQLAAVLQQQEGHAPDMPPLLPVERGGPLPVSFAQQRLWFLDRFEPGSAQYNMAAALRLRGALDTQALHGALNAIVARHESLRTRFVEVDGEPAQDILPRMELPLPVTDLGGLAPEERRQRAQELAREEALRPFDLEHGPLLRTQLLRLEGEEGEGDHILLVAMHHIVSDGWSMRVLVQDLVALYGAFTRGEASPLPPLDIQYADYAHWQRQWLQGDALQRQLDYWQEQLEGAPALLNLPTDRPRPPVPAQDGGDVPFVLDAEETAALRQLAREQGATLFMVLLAGLDVVLARWSGDADLCVGSPIANRTQSAIEPLIGCFVNTLVLRARVDMSDSFEALLRQVRATTLGAYAHQDMPFEQLVEQLRPVRDTSHAPLFQVMLTLLEAPLPALRLPGLEVEQLPGAPLAAKFDLTVDLQEDAQGIAGRLEFNAGLFDAATIERLGTHLRGLLRSVAVQPRAPLHAHDLLGVPQLAQAVAARRKAPSVPADSAPAAAQPYEASQGALEATLATLWSQLLDAPRVGRHDDFFALGGHSLLATRLVSRLRDALGIELPVRAVFEAPSIAQLAARLQQQEGNTEAAPALVPVERGGPLPLSFAQQRLWFLDRFEPGSAQYNMAAALRLQGTLDGDALRHALNAVVVRHESLRTRFLAVDGEPVQAIAPELALPLPVTDLGGLAPEQRQQRAGELASDEALRPFDLEHGPLLRTQLLRLAAEDHVLLVTMHHIVSDGWSMRVLVQDLVALYGAFSRGEASPLAPLDVQYADYAHWQRQWLQGEVLRRQVDYWRGQLEGAPALSTLPTDRPRPPVPALEGGELPFALDAGETAALRRLARAQGTTLFMVLLAALDVLLARWSGQDDVCVGSPIANRTQSRIEPLIGCFVNTLVLRARVDASESFEALLRQVRATTLGAYAHQDMPFEQLVEHLRPARDTSHTPLFQVMLTLQEAQLPALQLPGLRVEQLPGAPAPAKFDLTVDLQDDAQGIAGRLEFNAGLFDAATIERFGADLRKLLNAVAAQPRAPLQALGVLDAVTSGGTVAYKALPVPELPTEESYVAPRTPLELTLADLWTDILRVPQVGAHDDFFALGGHSLLATRVMSRLHQAFGVELPLRALFEAPTVERMALRVEAALQEQADDPADGALGDVPPLLPLPRDAELPLSFAQQRLWFLDRFEPGTSQYNMPAALRLKGTLHLPALQRTFDAIVGRHESLRTRFEVSADGQPVQRIDAPAPTLLPLVDLGALPPAAREAETERLARAEAQAPFDLARGPLLRQTLLRLAPEEHVLLVTMHHIVSDGWSLSVLVREVAALYAAHAQGEEASPLPPLAVQYADYAAWQRQWLQGPVLQRQLDYWRGQLADAPALLALPTDRPRPPVRTHNGASLPFALDAATAAGLGTLCQSQGATLFMGLLAGFSLLLARYSGQRDVSVGSFIANRTRAEVEPLIGFFLNTLVLRTQVEPNDSFTDLLRQVRDTTLQAYAHQHVPFEQLLEALRPQRDTSYSPLFQVMLVLQNLPDQSLSLPGLELEMLELAHDGARFDLTLELFEQPEGGLQGRLEFNTDLFDGETVARLGTRLQELLRALIARPQAPLHAHDILGAQEHRQLLAWNATRADYPRELTIAQCFEQQVQAQPDATALVFRGEQLSYRALNARANRIAHHLRAQGVGPDVLVGVCLQRGMDTIAAVLGILKAGGAYLPLDADYPPERLGFMLEDAQPRLLLSERAIADRLPAKDVPVLLLDAQASELAVLPDTDPPATATPRNLAYAMFTSGSTGRPKGVLVEQQGLGNQVSALGRRYGLNREDRVLQFAALSFDMSVEEIFGALLHGAALVLRDDSWLAGPSDFAALCERNRITVANLPTSFWRLLVTAPDFRLPACMRQVMVGGEAVLPADLRAWFAAPSRPALFNAYGPTEATVNAAIQQPTDDPASWQSIGAPMANTRIHLLDEQLNPVPVGIAGELYIAGDGVARGYLGRAALTAERFLPEPFAPQPGQRMYRSGDLARWRADGTVEYLGRVDHQVKIRGFRVELGEIQSVLDRQPGVREALVLAREDAPGGARLVAYVCPDEGATLQPAALRAGLAQTLPEYMVPAHVMVLERMPLTPNGKIDRRALPAPELQDAEGYAAPRTPLEHQLAALWAEVLHLPRVGIHDNFFALGGHSLLAVQLIERMRRADIPVDVRTLFSQPTIAALAESQGHARAEVAVPPNGIPQEGCDAIVPGMLPLVALEQAHIDAIVRATPGGARNIQDIYPLAPLQEGILFHHRSQLEGDAYLLPTQLAFAQRDLLDRFVDALQRVIARHDILRTAVLWEGLPQPVQVVWRQASMRPEELQLQPGPEGDVATQLQARFDPAHWRMDVRQAPLLRAVAFAHDAEHDRWGQEATSGRWLLQLMLHHLTSDHTTGELVVHEVLQLLHDGHANNLPAPVPFRNAVAQALLGVPQAEHEAFFRRTLGPVEEPTLPFGLVDVQGRGTGIEESIEPLPTELSRRIRAQARAAGVSAASLMHLAWALVLARTAGRSHVVFGTLLFGRMQGGGAGNAVGMFINTLPIAIDLAGRGARDALLSTHQLLAELLVHEHASLALAQRCSGVPAPAPLFSSLLNMRHTPDAGTAGLPAGSGIQVVSAQERTNYPVVLSVDDTGEGFSLNPQVDARIGTARVAQYMRQALEGLVQLLETAPDAPVALVQVLPQAELRQLQAWNAGAAVQPREGTVVRQFEDRVRENCDAVAVVFEGTHLSYRELNARANRLAHHLRAQGVGPEVLVGVCMEPGLDLIVALLAVLKAGGAYLPLDPAYPAERLAHMLDDARPVLVLSMSAIRPELVEGLSFAQVLCLDRDAAVWQALPDTDPAPLAGPQTLAYVIYTSGSTGKPKGAQLTHGNMARLFDATRALFDFGSDDVWTLFHSYAFDFSVWEIWGALLHGGRLVVVPHIVTRSPERFLELLARERVTVLNQTPSAFQQLVQADQHAHADLALKHVIFGGEALNRAALAPWFAKHGDAQPRLVNMYGITETTVHVTWHVLGADETAAPGCIGRPLADLSCHVLDEFLNPAPIGVAGELYVAGAGVARGYLGRPGLTAERFVPDPLSAEPGGRMYRSGDLARWLPDGTLDYLGRADHQVKIRGFRIELGEIEAALAAQAGVREALVLAREDVPGDKRLVAYVVAAADEAPSVTDLRAALAKALPGYMVPSHIIPLDAFPLTANGKIDRKALPAPGGTRSGEGYTAPRTPLEGLVARAWAEVLRLDQVGVTDNFFELGGHSLLAIQLVERLRAEGVAVDVRTLFANPTVEELLAARDGVHARVAVPDNRIPPGCTAITPDMLPLAELTQAQIDTVARQVPGGMANIQDIYPLAPLQEGLLFHHLMTTEGDAYLLDALLAFDARAQVDRFTAALQVLVERHDVLRTGVLWDGLPQPLQVVWREGMLQVEERAIDPQAGDVATQLRGTPARLDVRQAPLLHCRVAHDAPNNRWLVQVLLHHLVVDATGMGVLVAEAKAVLDGQAATLPPSVPFRNHVAQARLGMAPGEHEAFFKTMLADVDEPTAPFGLLDVQGDGSGTEELRRPLDAELARRLRRQAREAGVGVASLMHLAWAQVLARASGRNDVVFGTVLFGRMHGGAGADRALGMFINTLPVRIALGGEGVRDSLLRTHRTLTGLLLHEHASLALAQRCSGVAAPSPLFSAVLNYRHPDMQAGASLERDWDGMRMLEAGGRSNYPLNLSVDDLGDEGFALTAQVQGGRVAPERICDYMTKALDSLVALLERSPDTPVREVQVLPQDELQRQIVEWNAGVAVSPPDATVVRQFEAQVLASREAVALSFEDEQLSYRELNARANRLAHHLRAQGVGPEVLVGLCAQPGLELIVGLLAILKAGGASLPLDPSAPAERLGMVLEEAAPLLVLMQARLADALPPGHTVPLFRLDQDQPVLQALPESDPPPLAGPRDLAYVIYTSGSTGRPKGVRVQHGNLATTLAASRTMFGFGPTDRIHATASFTFDIWLFEVLLPLLVGGSVRLVPRERVIDVPAFVAGLADCTALHAVPALMRRIVQEVRETGSGGAAGTLPGMRCIFSGGDAVAPDLLQDMRAAFPNAQVRVLYGPTEAAILCTAHLHEGTPAARQMLGRPLGNTTVYVLDAAGSPLPVGVPGELFLGGPSVARDYLRRPDLTAERFVPDPFATVPGARLYRTGDLVRWLDSGELEFLGRTDLQVKIRGFRVEPGEIEIHLAQQPQVREALVLAHRDARGDNQLVAYATPREGHAIDAEALRAALAQSLPGYMVPSHILALDAFPLTPNGKIDRKALPAPQAVHGEAGMVAPRTPLEHALAAIWAEVLGLERIGIHDNFFALGGHSLLATQAVSRMRTAVASELPLQALFEAPTVAEMAGRIGEPRASQPAAEEWVEEVL